MKKALLIAVFVLMLVPVAQASERGHRDYPKHYNPTYRYTYIWNNNFSFERLEGELREVNYKIQDLREEKRRVERQLRWSQQSRRWRKEDRLEDRLCQLEDRIERLEAQKRRLIAKIDDYRHQHVFPAGYVSYDKHGKKSGVHISLGF